MKAASADTASSLRDWVTAAFQTMNEVSEDFFSSRRQFWPFFVSADWPERHWWLLGQAGGRAQGQLNGAKAMQPTIYCHLHAHSSPSVKSCIFYTPSMIQNLSWIQLKTGIYSPKTRMEINLDPFETASDLQLCAPNEWRVTNGWPNQEKVSHCSKPGVGGGMGS